MILPLIVNMVNKTINSDDVVKIYTYLGIVVLTFILAFVYTIIFGKSKSLKKKSHAILMSPLLFLIAIGMVWLFDYVIKYI